MPENKTITFASLKTGYRCGGTSLATAASVAGRLAPVGEVNGEMPNVNKIALRVSIQLSGKKKKKPEQKKDYLFYYS